MTVSKVSGSLWVALSVVLSGVTASAATPEALVARFVESNDFHGVVLVARDDGLLHYGAYGQADVEAGRSTGLGTRYQLGSISKYLASLVVLKLVDEGTLSLTRPISEYLPTYRKDVGGKVTLHHLLSHTSGVPNDLATAFRANREIAKEELSTAAAVERYASGALQFEPGSRFDYSHSNWILVRAIIESATGRTYEQNVQRFLEPLKLKDTGIFSGDFSSAVPGSAMGYTSVRPQPARSSIPNPVFIACAGGAYSTATDLLTLSRALHAGKLVSPKALEQLRTPYVADEGYSYGGRVKTLKLGGRDEVVAWHSGSNGPFKSRLSRVLSNGLTVILLSNTNADLGKLATLTEELLQAISSEPKP
ncbi:serine hydrolase domain-containing protein [Pyxidicoccus xibeiensis]|uniref:serine hydrolase domain-containing protein n=1 Tax=Pyxidicoccus xibeiensis TaxID=2906759 RepID=UPI0020A79BA4|nr:serine hydrolase domain-containing protein [Pyxidicoccus xibeiensis]MCP3141632.1 beta-lactamase family protein [Pyxidicoccus xibeiensis]